MLQGPRDSTPRDSQGPACVPRARQPWANRGDGAQPHPSRRLHKGAVQTEEAPEQRGPGNRGASRGGRAWVSTWTAARKFSQPGREGTHGAGRSVRRCGSRGERGQTLTRRDAGHAYCSRVRRAWPSDLALGQKGRPVLGVSASGNVACGSVCLTVYTQAGLTPQCSGDSNRPFVQAELNVDASGNSRSASPGK